jgi:hypothetical protein
MPTVLRCISCGFILREYPELPDSPTYYQEEYHLLDGKCPKCGRPLPQPSKFVDAIQAKVKPNPATLHKSPLTSAFQHDYHNEVAES